MKKICYILLWTGLFPAFLAAQQRSISGKVTDAQSGGPLTGVSVSVPGSDGVATATNQDGWYTINVPQSATSLVFSYIGMKTVTEFISGRTSINVGMSAEGQNLEDVVVIGYGVQKKTTLTGSVSTVRSKELLLTKNESTVNMLTGKVPGLRVVQRTAEPGGYDNNLNIRGFKGSMLVVIDGVPSSGFERMDPNEIESISILKDAAASIYGIRASGGVLLVTTKKGERNGKFNINYSVNAGFQQFLGMPEGVTAVDYMMLTNEKYKRSFAANFIANVPPAFSYENMKPWMDGTYPSADWIGAAFDKTSPQIQHNLNMNGGTDKISYFFSFGYMKQDGLFKSGDLNYNRYNFRSNVTVNITKGLRAQVLTSGMMDEKNQPYQDLWTIFKYTWNQVPVDQIYANNNPAYPNVMDDNANPVVITDADKVGSKTFRKRNVNAQLSLQYDIPGVKGLSARGMYNINYGVDDNNEHKRQYTLYMYDAANDTYLPSDVQKPSTIRRFYGTGTNTLWQASLNYANTFAADHNVAATLVYEENHFKNDNFFAQRDVELPIDYLFGGLANPQQVGYMDPGGLNETAFKSVIGRLNYNYKSKYLAEFSFREDGSNRYMPGPDQWGFFPAVSVGWMLSREPFFERLIPEKWLSNLKIRASYGETGDEVGRAFNYTSGFNYPILSYIFGSNAVNGSTVRYGNPGLSWATNIKKNLALDFTLFGKLDGTVEVFRSDREGLPGSTGVTLPGTVGADLPEVNINSDRVQGFDAILSYRGVFGKLGYTLTGNIGATRARTLHQIRGRSGNEYNNWRDNPLNRYQNIWWGLTYAGQFTSYEQIYNHAVNTGGGNNNVIPGDYYYEDWNEDGVIDWKDEHPIATSDIPLVNYGITLGLTYRGFDLSMLLQGAAGVYVQYAEQYAEPLMYDRSALTRFLDSWRTENPDDNVFDPNTKWIPGYYPAMGSPVAQGTKAIQDASYLRIKTLELGYSLPASMLKRAGLKGVRIYANSYNLATFTKLMNYDPEHPGQKPGAGFDDALGGYKYPLNRTFNIGANVSL